MLIGIAVRTANANGKAAHDIGQLWNRFRSEAIIEKIPNKADGDVLSVYTNFKGDHTEPYDTILGCRVTSLHLIPTGMVGQSFDGGLYGKYLSQGDLTKGAVINTWSEIWQTDLDRAFSADFEVYGEKATNPIDAKVDVYVALNE